MNEKNEVQKIRWNIAKAMSCVYETLKGSKLKIKENKQYETAADRLKKLYNISLTQVWILSYVCERYLEEDDSTGKKKLLHSWMCL